MGSKAKSKFWLDGGYDRDAVEACQYHPNHRWIVLRLGDVLEYTSNPDERMVICQGCYVPRCGHSTEANPCTLPRHHHELHRYEDGTVEPSDVWPGSEKPWPPQAEGSETPQ